MKKAFLFTLGLVCALTAPRAAGLVDSTFNPGSGAAGGIVEQALPLPNGQILICGNFTSFNGRNRAYVARLNADGSVDESFYAQPGYWVRNMALQADGKIVIGGYFTTVGGVPRNLVARLHPNGSLDGTFDPGLGARDIIAGGIDGNIDPFVFWVAVQPDQKIIITGNFRNYNGASSTGIVRINPDGTRDTSFNVGSGLDSWGRHIEVLPNGQILVSGWFTAYNGRWFNRLVRINPDGSPDTGFNPFFGDRTAIYCTAQQPDGKIIACGHSLNYDGLFKREIERLNPDGSVDSSFVGFTNEKTETAVLQPDGKVIVVGSFTQANNTPRASLARFNADGTLDPDFSASIDNFVWGAALQADGKLLISGGFYTVDGVARSGVARLNTGLSSGTTGGSTGGTAGGTTGGTVQDTSPVLFLGAPTPNSITLGWSDSSAIRTGYAIERKDSAGVFVQIGTAGASTKSFVAGGLSPSSSYTFRLRASNSNGGAVYSNEATGSTSAAPASGPNSAVFVTADNRTQGNWPGVYGAEGYSLFGDQSSLPAWASVTPIGKSDWTWQWSTQDGRCLRRPNGTDRIAACWYSGSSYSIDLNLTDGRTHRVAIYFLDWDNMGRRETIQISDASTGTILDGRSISSFYSGAWLVWDLTGHVKITMTANSGNAVASGIFFGSGGFSGGGTGPVAAMPVISPGGGTFSAAQQVTISTTTSGGQIRFTTDGSEPSSTSTLYSGPITVATSLTLKAKTFASGNTPSATATATFTIGTTGGGGSVNKAVFAGADTSTKGNWRGIYGSQGYYIYGKGPLPPAYAQMTSANKQDWIWSDNTSDSRALQTPDGSSRIASCWYGDQFTVDLRASDTATHRVSVYLLDWDNSGRSQTIEVLDGDTGAVLQSQTVSGFSGGQYLTWDFKGHITLRLTKVSGYNAVVNGLFFSPSPSTL